MKKRLKFKCHKCSRKYSLQRDIEDGNHVLSVQCPYCHAEGIVDLRPYRKPVDRVLRGAYPNEQADKIFKLELPDVLPTQAKP